MDPALLGGGFLSGLRKYLVQAHELDAACEAVGGDGSQRRWIEKCPNVDGCPHLGVSIPLCSGGVHKWACFFGGLCQVAWNHPTSLPNEAALAFADACAYAVCKVLFALRKPSPQVFVHKIALCKMKTKLGQPPNGFMGRPAACILASFLG